MPYFKGTLVDEQGHFLQRECFADDRADAAAALAGVDEATVADALERAEALGLVILPAAGEATPAVAPVPMNKE